MSRVLRSFGFLLLGGCGLFPSLSDLTSGDASTQDAFSSDAHVDVADVTVDAGRFCDSVSPKPDYCEDFDETTAPDLSQIEGYTLTGGGTLSLDSTDFRSAPRSLFIFGPAFTTGEVQAALFPTIGATPSTAKLSFDMKVDPGDSDVVFSGFVMHDGTSLLLVVGPEGIGLQEGGYALDPMYPDHPSFPVDWTKGWHHLDLVLEHAGAQALSSLTLDGVALETKFVCDSRFTFAGGLQIATGYVYDGPPADARSVHVDNVVAYDIQ